VPFHSLVWLGSTAAARVSIFDEGGDYLFCQDVDRFAPIAATQLDDSTVTQLR
jgi:hypothetical protein